MYRNVLDSGASVGHFDLPCAITDINTQPWPSIHIYIDAIEGVRRHAQRAFTGYDGANLTHVQGDLGEFCEHLARTVDEIDVAVQQIVLGHLVEHVRGHAEVLERYTTIFARAYDTPDRHPEGGTLRESRERPCGQHLAEEQSGSTISTIGPG